MKIAVLSDVHGNLPALTAVLDDILAWQPDLLVVNGDLVSRGPNSVECLQLLHSVAPTCRYLTGNHETYVMRCADEPADPDSPTLEIDRFADWTVRKLGPWLETIRRWDDHLDLTGLQQGASVHITHGSRLGNRDGISARTADAELPAKLGVPRDLFVGSHTHKPLVRSFNDRLVVNTGSVGQPMDADPRAAYGRFTLQAGKWQADIARVTYDKAQAERDFVTSGFLAEAGPMAQLIYLELQQSRAHVGPWRQRYMAPVKAGQISVRESVQCYLDDLQ